MSVKENLESYSIPQLRLLVKEHNKKVQSFIKDELKSIREKFKEEKLIKIIGIKDKTIIIDKMLKQESHFINVPKKVLKSQEEKEVVMSGKMQTLLNSIYKNYKKDGDKDEVEDGIKQLFIIAKNNEIPIKLSKGKMSNEIIKDVQEEKKKEEGKPPRPAKPAQFIFKEGKLVLVTLLEKRKLRPAKPTREAPKIEGTHEMPDGSLMTGDEHQANSKPVIVIEDKPKKKSKKKFKIIKGKY